MESINNQESKEPEKINCPAIKNQDTGKIYTAKKDHASILENTTFNETGDGQKGFLTSEGRFVGREEAAVIAQKNNQIRDCYKKQQIYSLNSYHLK